VSNLSSETECCVLGNSRDELHMMTKWKVTERSCCNRAFEDCRSRRNSSRFQLRRTQQPKLQLGPKRSGVCLLSSHFRTGIRRISANLQHDVPVFSHITGYFARRKRSWKHLNLFLSQGYIRRNITTFKQRKSFDSFSDPLTVCHTTIKIRLNTLLDRMLTVWRFN
jgi:hypothetical protein